MNWWVPRFLQLRAQELVRLEMYGDLQESLMVQSWRGHHRRQVSNPKLLRGPWLTTTGEQAQQPCNHKELSFLKYTSELGNVSSPEPPGGSWALLTGSFQPCETRGRESGHDGPRPKTQGNWKAINLCSYNLPVVAICYSAVERDDMGTFTFKMETAVFRLCAYLW